MEILVICSVKFVYAIQYILRGMAMYDIQQHSYSHAMCRVNQLLEIFRGSVTTAGCEEIVNLVAKRCVVCMLHNSHQLYHIVPKVIYPGEHILCEFFVSRHSLIRCGYSNMSLIHTSAFWLGRSCVLKGILLMGWWVPESCFICWRHAEILSDVLDPSRKSVYPLSSRQLQRYLVSDNLKSTSFLFPMGVRIYRPLFLNCAVSLDGPPWVEGRSRKPQSHFSSSNGK